MSGIDQGGNAKLSKTRVEKDKLFRVADLYMDTRGGKSEAITVISRPPLLRSGLFGFLKVPESGPS